MDRSDYRGKLAVWEKINWPEVLSDRLAYFFSTNKNNSILARKTKGIPSPLLKTPKLYDVMSTKDLKFSHVYFLHHGGIGRSEVCCIENSITFFKKSAPAPGLKLLENVRI